jgi:hypothetical protein
MRRNVEDARQRLREYCLAGAGRANQQDIGFRQLDVVELALVVEPLVVVVNGDRHHLLGGIFVSQGAEAVEFECYLKSAPTERSR